MSKTYSTIICLLIGLSCLAQPPKIEKSEEFDPPDNSTYNKVLLMKNGNTLYFRFTIQGGVAINVYNKERKLAATNEILSDMWFVNYKHGLTVSGLFEINNEAVLFVVVTEKRIPTLYRIRVNSSTGKKIDEVRLGEASKTRFLLSFMDSEAIFVEKDPESDCYAVVYFNSFAKDKSEDIKVVHYNGNHTPISSALYESPEENFKYVTYIGAVVDGDKRIFLSTYCAASLQGRDGKVYIASLSAGEKKFVNKSLNFTEDFKSTTSIMAYNRSNNSLQLLTVSYANGSSIVLFGAGTSFQYASFISYIDPETLELKSVKPIMDEKVNEYAQTTLHIEGSYRGLPQNMIINKDNSTTILSEEITWKIERYASSQGNTHTIHNTFLGALAVNEINADGVEKSGYMIRKTQKAGGLYPPLYISARIKGRWKANQGHAEHNSYMSYDYVNTDKNRYIIFNDNIKNFDKEEDDRRRKVADAVRKLNTICYSLNEPGINKSFLFGDTSDEGKSTSLNIDASDFDPKAGLYATVLVERDGRDKTTRIAWITFE